MTEEITRPETPTVRYKGPQCSKCTALRRVAGKEAKTYVTATIPCATEIVRYLRCDFCGNTWTAREAREEQTTEEPKPKRRRGRPRKTEAEKAETSE